MKEITEEDQKSTQEINRGLTAPPVRYTVKYRLAFDLESPTSVTLLPEHSVFRVNSKISASRLSVKLFNCLGVDVTNAWTSTALFSFDWQLQLVMVRNSTDTSPTIAGDQSFPFLVTLQYTGTTTNSHGAFNCVTTRSATTMIPQPNPLLSYSFPQRSSATFNYDNFSFEMFNWDLKGWKVGFSPIGNAIYASKEHIINPSIETYEFTDPELSALFPTEAPPPVTSTHFFIDIKHPITNTKIWTFAVISDGPNRWILLKTTPSEDLVLAGTPVTSMTYATIADIQNALSFNIYIRETIKFFGVNLNNYKKYVSGDIVSKFVSLSVVVNNVDDQEQKIRDNLYQVLQHGWFWH